MHNRPSAPRWRHATSFEVGGGGGGGGGRVAPGSASDNGGGPQR